MVEANSAAKRRSTSRIAGSLATRSAASSRTHRRCRFHHGDPARFYRPSVPEVAERTSWSKDLVSAASLAISSFAMFVIVRFPVRNRA
jgi:hypothetical protein